MVIYLIPISSTNNHAFEPAPVIPSGIFPMFSAMTLTYCALFTPIFNSTEPFMVAISVVLIIAAFLKFIPSSETKIATLFGKWIQLPSFDKNPILILFIGSDAASYVNGQTIEVNGGLDWAD